MVQVSWKAKEILWATFPLFTSFSDGHYSISQSASSQYVLFYHSLRSHRLMRWCHERSKEICCQTFFWRAKWSTWRGSIIIYVIGDIFPKKYFKIDKIRATIIFLTNKAHIWYDIVTRNREGHGLCPIRRWKYFKKLFIEKKIPNGFILKMRLRMYKIRLGGMSIGEFKSKFDEHPT